MTTREKRLAVAVAAIGALWGGTQGLSRYRAALSRNQAIERRAVDALDDAEFAEMRGERAHRRLADWADRSLPTDRNVAKSLYEDWVRGQLGAAGLEAEQVSDRTLNRRNPQFGELSLEIRAAGSLAQLTDFLYKFYAAPHLHRISTATLTGADKGGKVTAILGVDALILPNCTRNDKLAAGEPTELVRPLDDIRATLVSRNVFAPHEPGASTAAAGAAGAELSAFTGDGLGGWILWIKTTEPAKTHRFRVGDSIQFGEFTGTLVDVDGRVAVIETAAGRVEIRLGQKLSEAKALATEST